MTKSFRVLVLLVLIGSLPGDLARAANLESLFAAADVVIIGTLSPQASATGATLLLNVTPERVFKGTESLSAPISVQWASQPEAVGRPALQLSVFTLPTAWRGVWFLKRLPTGVLSPIPIRLGSMASTLDLFYQLSTTPMPQALSRLFAGSASVIDQLAIELANAATRKSSGDFPGNLVFATYSLDSPVIHQAFTYLAGLPQSRAKATGLAGLLSRGDVNGLLALEQQVAAIDTADLVMPLMELRVSFRNPDSASIGCLARLAMATGGYRDALGDTAMHVLSAIHTKDTLTALAGGLDSPRGERRRRAVVGLSSFANGLPGQSSANMANLAYMRQSGPAPFRTDQTLRYSVVSPHANEAAFVGFWKDWWGQNKVQLGL